MSISEVREAGMNGGGIRGAILVVAAMLALGASPAHAATQRLCTEKLIRMSDGVRLHAWVSRLAPDRPRPVLFMMDSYGRQGVPGQGAQVSDACPQSLPDDYV